MRIVLPLAALLILLPLGVLPAASQAITKPEPPPAVTYSRTDLSAPAKELFGRTPNPYPAKRAASFGGYARGCLSGGVALPIDGTHWQVMRLSRNRNWGHPAMIEMLQRFAAQVPAVTSWPGILVGDISQPRGGPMLTGHASHQIGLDADIWLTPMPATRFTSHERETVFATNVVADDWNDINPALWTKDHFAIIKLAAKQPNVERLFVNPAIKKALCREEKQDRSWLATVRPMYGHNYHMHIRLKCPKGQTGCTPQTPPPRNDGCGEELAWWFSDEARKPKKPAKPAPPMTLAQLPNACRAVIAQP